jgi:hypothetical protein
MVEQSWMYSQPKFRVVQYVHPGWASSHYITLLLIHPTCELEHTLTFFLLHVKHPPLDLRCDFFGTKPVLLRTISDYARIDGDGKDAHHVAIQTRSGVV